MDQERRRALVARYREGPSIVEAALAGATDAELDARPPTAAGPPARRSTTSPTAS